VVASSEPRPRRSSEVAAAVGPELVAESLEPFPSRPRSSAVLPADGADLRSSTLGATDAPEGIAAGTLWPKVVLPVTPHSAGRVATPAARVRRMARFMMTPWR
jgi:hypothetical protein